MPKQNIKKLKAKMIEAFDCDPPVLHDILAIISEWERKK